MRVVHQIWHQVFSTQPAPSRPVVVGAGLAALALVAVPPLWRRTRHLVTMAHEASHAAAAVASRRRLSGIRLHADTSGLTLTRGRSSGPGMVVTVAAGYLGPALIGLGGAYLLRKGHVAGLLWSVVALLAVMVPLIRNWFGLLAVLVAGAAALAVSWLGSDSLRAGCAFTGAWFLLLAAPRPVLELQAARRRGGIRDSDADTLARLTRLPGLLWVGWFLVSTVAALVVGGQWLLAQGR